jgi:hypothetical protein
MTARFLCYHKYMHQFFLEKLLCTEIEGGIHIIPKISTQIGLSKENNLIFEIRLSKDNGRSIL